MNYPDTNVTWFTVGFAIDETGSVLLIEKQKDWCKGLWNGVGGGVEERDVSFASTGGLLQTARNAMAREFEEETGLFTLANQWDLFCVINEPKACVYFFRFICDRAWLSRSKQMEAEKLALVHYSISSHPDMMPNLCWLIPMARCPKMLCARVDEQGGQYDGNR